MGISEEDILLSEKGGRVGVSTGNGDQGDGYGSLAAEAGY